MSGSYEAQLALVQNLKRSRTELERDIAWSEPGGALGLARTSDGRIELFLPGARLESRLPRVREALEYQRWFRTGGDELEANRILLPAAGHFEQVAAFLSTELLRNGASTDLPAAFARTEPLIELAIEDLLLADAAMLGLCGEMLLLNALVRAAPDARVAEVLEAWKGYRETARDFQLGPVGVEIKTTTQPTSSHVLHGVQQLEPGHGVDGVPESNYVLASLGVEWLANADDPGATSLPALVDSVVDRSRNALGSSAEGLINALVVHVADYGDPRRTGYVHGQPDTSARFRRPFRLGFARAYDMMDPGIRLLTTDDLHARPFIDRSSLRIRVNLPEKIRGDVNPVAGLGTLATWILGMA